MLAHEDRYGKNLFACRTARYPNPHRVFRTFALKQSRNHKLFEFFEGILITKEIRDIDQKIAKERVDFFRILSQTFGIGADGAKLHHLHSSADAPQECLGLIASKIMSDLFAQ